MNTVKRIVKAILRNSCEHCGGTGWIGDIKCPACS